jgi:hypothetical protein
MGRPRDPLSTEYDNFSHRFLEACRGDLYGWHTATVRSPAGDPVNAKGETAHERAVIRSLYYVLNSTGATGPQGGQWVKNPVLSLQLGGWAEPDYDGGVLSRLFRRGPRRRVLRARLVGGLTAAEHVDPARAYTLNPDLQAQAQEL